MRSLDLRAIRDGARDGTLQEWLRGTGKRTLADRIDVVSQEENPPAESLYQVFWKDSNYARQMARIEAYTDDPRFLRAARRAVFSQNELACRIKERYRTIYLCGEGPFVLSRYACNTGYVGLGGPRVDFENGYVPSGVTLENVTYDIGKVYVEPACFDVSSVTRLPSYVFRKNMPLLDTLLNDAAERGNSQAQLVLAIACSQGTLGSTDRARGARWALKAAEQGLPEAQYHVAELCERRAPKVAELRSQDSKDWYASAFEGFAKRAKEGSAAAAASACVCCALGQGTRSDKRKASAFLKMAIELARDHDPLFLKPLASHVPSLRGLPRSPNLTKQLNASAASLQAKYYLAHRGEDPYLRKRMEMLTSLDFPLLEAVAENDGQFAYEMAQRIDSSPYLYSDSGDGIDWLVKSAEAGCSAGQYSLGMCYAEGNFVRRSDAQATSWLARAAEQGEAEAMFELGLLYSEMSRKQGMNPDHAADLFLESASWGVPNAMQMLAQCYASGTGVPVDNKKAAWWIREELLCYGASITRPGAPPGYKPRQVDQHGPS